MDFVTKCKALKYGKISFDLPREDYREFTSIDEVEAWGKEKYELWEKTYRSTFQTAGLLRKKGDYNPVSEYLGETYQQINNTLRGFADEENDAIRFLINDLLIAISSAPIIGEKIVLYRQVSEEVIQEIVSRNKSDDSPYQEKGFMSTSMMKMCCAENCGSEKYMLKMYVEDLNPIHAIFANVIDPRDEEELLLRPGLFIRLSGYPYADKETGKIIYEVQVYSMDKKYF